MFKKALTTGLTLSLLAACGSDSAGKKEPKRTLPGEKISLQSLEVDNGSIPLPGQQVIHTRNTDYTTSYYDADLGKIIECNYAKKEIINTVVEVNGDDIYVLETSKGVGLKAGPQECLETTEKTGTLFKKSFEAELKAIKELNHKNLEDILYVSCEECALEARMVEGKAKIFLYGDFAGNGQTATFDLIAEVNTQTPWTSPIITHKGVGVVDGEKFEFGMEGRLSGTTDLGQYSYNLEDYKLKIYKSLAVDVSSEILPKLAAKTFYGEYDTDKEEPLSFTQTSAGFQYKQIRVYSPEHDVQCGIVEKGAVAKVEMHSDEARSERLPEETITIEVEDIRDTISRELTRPEHREKCRQEYIEDMGGDTYSTSLSIIMKNDNQFLKDKSRDYEGDLYTAQ